MIPKWPEKSEKKEINVLNRASLASNCPCPLLLPQQSVVRAEACVQLVWKLHVQPEVVLTDPPRVLELIRPSFLINRTDLKRSCLG